MAALDEKEFLKHIKESELAGLYFFYGPDEFRKNKLYSSLISSFKSRYNAVPRQFERHNFNIEILEDESEAVPFGGGKRVFVLRDIDVDMLDADTYSRYVKVIENLPPWCTVIHILHTAEADTKGGKRWKSFLKTAEKCGITLNFQKYDKSVLAKKLCDLAKRRQCDMSKDTAFYLIERSGDNTETLINEMEKLCAYVDEGTITKENVELLAGKTMEASVYDLSKAILRSDGATAYKLIDHYFYMKIDPIVILSGVTGTFVDLYRAKAAAVSGKKASDVINEFGYRKNLEFRVNNAMRDCSKYSMNCLRQCINLIIDADYSLKSSRLDKRIELEKLIAGLLVLFERERRGERI